MSQFDLFSLCSHPVLLWFVCTALHFAAAAAQFPPLSFQIIRFTDSSPTSRLQKCGWTSGFSKHWFKPPPPPDCCFPLRSNCLPVTNCCIATASSAPRGFLLFRAGEPRKMSLCGQSRPHGSVSASSQEDACWSALCRSGSSDDVNTRSCKTLKVAAAGFPHLSTESSVYGQNLFYLTFIFNLFYLQSLLEYP